jgi:hypothetical protein
MLSLIQLLGSLEVVLVLALAHTVAIQACPLAL